MKRTDQLRRELLRLARDLGDPRHPLAILAEGNASVRLGPNRFLVKASGACLQTLKPQDLVECRTDVLLPMFERPRTSDAEVKAALLRSRVDARARKPSVESLFHAWLLTLPGVEFVGHTHPVAATALLCSPRAGEFARKRIFPDEIVCCDVESVLVPYTDPGLPLARAIRDRTQDFLEKHQRPPRVVLIQNHGVITLGRTPDAVLAAMLMVEKAASIRLGAATFGGPVFLSAANVARIAGRADEAARRKLLKL